MAARLALRERIPYAALFALAIALGLAAGASAKIGIAAAFGVAFVVLVMGNLLAGVCLFTVLAFFALLPTFGGPAFSLAKVAGLLIGFAWFAGAATRDERRTEFAAAHPAMTYVIVSFLAWAALSIIWSEDRGLAATALSRYALNAVLFVIVYGAVRRREHLIAVVCAFALGATVAAAYGLVVPPAAASPGRVTGTIGDPNELAAQLVVGLVLAFVLSTLAKGRPLLRLVGLAAAGMCALVLVLTLSRGGLIALAIAVAASIVIGGRWRATAVALAIAVIIGTVGYFAYAASPTAKARVTTVDTGSGRTDIWTVGWRMVAANPAGGVGAGNFANSSIHYLLAPGQLTRTDRIVVTPEPAHNTFLNILADLGAVGFAFFAAIVGFSLLCLLRAARIFERLGQPRMELLARGMLVALIGLLAADFFISEMYSKQLWLMFALCAPVLAIARREEAAAEEAAAP